MLAGAPDPAVRAEATALPFSDASFGSVALPYVLYHLPEPARALVEVRAGAAPRRARRGCGPEPSRLAGARSRASQGTADLRRRARPGDARQALREVELEPWDAPLLELPSREAVRRYLVGKGVESQQAQAVAEGAEIPLSVTKRGALAFARKA